MCKRNFILGGAPDWLPYIGLMVVLMLPMFSGCGAPTYGRLQSSQEVTRVFQNDQVLANYFYYYSGFERVPYGIIGIDANYTLHSTRWKPIDLNPTLLNQLVYRMHHVYNLEPRGAWILNPAGKRVGIWYSSRYHTTVIMEKGNQIVVVTPEPPALRGVP